MKEKIIAKRKTEVVAAEIKAVHLSEHWTEKNPRNK